MTAAADEAPGGVGAAIAHGLAAALKPPRFGGRAITLAIFFVILGWLSTSIYRVEPDEQGVVLHFGKWVETAQPGLHLHWPYPIDATQFPKVTKVNQIQLGGGALPPGDPSAGRERQMLTGDENIVEADGVMFWKIRDAGEYLFRVAEPETALKIAAEGALRDVISRTPIQGAMSDKRQQIADETRELLQKLLDQEHAGVDIMQVQLLRVEPPLAVIDSFNDVQRARADQERARNEAEAYANDILPRARGEAEHTRQDADAYRAQVVALAEGEAKAFHDLLAAYRTAPVVTAWRMYYEAIDEMLKKSARVLVDTSGKGLASVTPYTSVDSQRPMPRLVAPPPIIDLNPQPDTPRTQSAPK